jgi:chemotaxis protein CheX
MDVSYVNPFIKSLINAFKTMMNDEAKPGAPFLKKEPYPQCDVSGIIGLSGDAQGAIAICFNKVCALKVVSGMLGTEIKVVGPELTDGIGELANIIAGGAKQDLAQYNLHISLPNVVVGKDHMLTAMSGVPTLAVPFSSKFGDFIMEVCLKTPK